MNPHALMDTWPSTMPVYQFQHPGKIWNISFQSWYKKAGMNPVWNLAVVLTVPNIVKVILRTVKSKPLSEISIEEK